MERTQEQSAWYISGTLGGILLTLLYSCLNRTSERWHHLPKERWRLWHPSKHSWPMALTYPSQFGDHCPKRNLCGPAPRCRGSWKMEFCSRTFLSTCPQWVLSEVPFVLKERATNVWHLLPANWRPMVLQPLSHQEEATWHSRDRHRAGGEKNLVLDGDDRDEINPPLDLHPIAWTCFFFFLLPF